MPTVAKSMIRYAGGPVAARKTCTMKDKLLAHITRRVISCKPACSLLSATYLAIRPPPHSAVAAAAAGNKSVNYSLPGTESPRTIDAESLPGPLCARGHEILPPFLHHTIRPGLHDVYTWNA